MKSINLKNRIKFCLLFSLSKLMKNVQLIATAFALQV